MDDLLHRNLVMLRRMWGHRWPALFTAWVVGGVASVGIMFIPDKYEATARLFVNTDSILKPLMAGMTVEPDIGQRIAMLSRVLISRPNVEKLVHAVGLDSDAKSPEELERLVDTVAKSLVLQEAGRPNLYKVSFLDRHPERAKRMVDLFAKLFIDSGQGNRVSDSNTARRFIDEEIGVYEAKLQEAEGRLKEFRLRYSGMTPGQGKDFFVRLSDASAALRQVQLELREAENARDALKRGVASAEERSVAGRGSSRGAGGSLSDIDARIDALQRTLSGLLQRYTDAHPDVSEARRAIADLEEQRRRLGTSGAEAPPPESSADRFAGPRASEQIRVSLAQAEATVASLRTRAAEFASRYTTLQDSAKLMPQLEAEFAQLNRDYEINKKNYESLIARRESANISGEMQAVSGLGDFSIIDPPRVSPRPVSPNRLLLLPITLLLGVGSGIGLAFLRVRFSATFFDSAALRLHTELPILGVVSQVSDDGTKGRERRDLLRFGATLGAFFLAYAGAFAFVAIMTARAA